MMEDKTIMIKWPTGRYVLYLPNILDKAIIPDLKKYVFTTLFKNLGADPVNEETRYLLDAYIPEWVADHKEQWHDASLVFQREYKDPKRGATQKEQAAIKLENDARFATVKRTKKSYERSEKVFTAWMDIKERYNR